jgi:hypothetical protein
MENCRSKRGLEGRKGIEVKWMRIWRIWRKYILLNQLLRREAFFPTRVLEIFACQIQLGFNAH